MGKKRSHGGKKKRGKIRSIPIAEKKLPVYQEVNPYKPRLRRNLWTPKGFPWGRTGGGGWQPRRPGSGTLGDPRNIRTYITVNAGSNMMQADKMKQLMRQAVRAELPAQRVIHNNLFVQPDFDPNVRPEYDPYARPREEEQKHPPDDEEEKELPGTSSLRPVKEEPPADPPFKKVTPVQSRRERFLRELENTRMRAQEMRENLRGNVVVDNTLKGPFQREPISVHSSMGGRSILSTPSTVGPSLNVGDLRGLQRDYSGVIQRLSFPSRDVRPPGSEGSAAPSYYDLIGRLFYGSGFSSVDQQSGPYPI